MLLKVCQLRLESVASVHVIEDVPVTSKMHVCLRDHDSSSSALPSFISGVHHFG